MKKRQYESDLLYMMDQQTRKASKEAYIAHQALNLVCKELSKWTQNSAICDPLVWLEKAEREM